jgi:hypothetical protein
MSNSAAMLEAINTGLFDRLEADGTTKKGPIAKEWFDKGKTLTDSDPK